MNKNTFVLRFYKKNNITSTTTCFYTVIVDNSNYPMLLIQCYLSNAAFVFCLPF